MKRDRKFSFNNVVSSLYSRENILSYERKEQNLQTVCFIMQNNYIYLPSFRLRAARSSYIGVLCHSSTLE
jgi:hypothetical protein